MTALFQDSNVQIDSSLARFGAISYAIANINSVRIHSQDKGRTILIVLAVLVGLFAIGTWGDDAQSLSSRLMAIVLCALVVAGLVWMARKTTGTHTVLLRTSSGEAQAFTTHDIALAKRIQEALENAVIARK